MGLKRAAPVSRSASFSHGIKVRHGSLKKRPAATKTEQTVASRKKPVEEVASPFAGFARPSAADVRTLHTKLANLFGDRGRFQGGKRRGDILGTVVGTILSQNTTNTNSHRAFLRLREAFPTWDKVRLAKPKAVEDAIRCSGLAPKKTPWILTICRTAYEETGRTSLEHLRNMSKAEVHAYLCRFTGIGKKTAAIINLFDVGHPDMAVDTHVFRYAEQLGWVPSERERAQHNKKAKVRTERWPVISRDTTYFHLDATFPDELKYSMHLIWTDTEGGLPVVCPARKVLGFDGRQISIDGDVLRKPRAGSRVKKN